MYEILKNIFIDHLELLRRLKPVSKAYCAFLKYIESNLENIEQGLNMYYLDTYRDFNEKFGKLEGKEVYVFPTGIAGESLCSELKKNKVNVISFLDNDVMKENKEFVGTICKHASLLESVADIETKCVFIATAYSKNIPIMIEQMIGYGIRSNNIFIR